MDTKERKTPVQDALSGARISPPAQKLLPGTARKRQKSN
jgi:hypothetical protein